MRISFITIITAFLLILFLTDCQDNTVLIDDFSLGLSTDTVYFDTVLTTLGSVTRFFQIKNPENQPIELERIYLAGGDESVFRLNLDGTPGNDFRNVIIPAGDSLFMFVEMTLDPMDENNPILIKDSIVIRSQSQRTDVKLIAYGQDVHIFNGEIFGSQTWTKDKPYLIVNSAAIDTNEVLTIEPGTRIYLTSTSSLLVWGRIEAQGTYEEPIVFTGARFDDRFEESAGQWRTIYIGEQSTDNLMEHVVIRNATAGLQVGYPDVDNQAQIELRNCMILNSSALGIFSFNSTIDAYNTIIADCGSMAVYVQMGGTYNFYHCTLSNVSAYYPGFFEDSYKARALPSLFFTNYFDWFDLDEEWRIQEVTFPEDVEMNFYNSIIYGIRDSEVFFKANEDAELKYRFDHCLLKLHSDSIPAFNEASMISPLYNVDPAFITDSIAVAEYDFSVRDTSAVINAGDPGLIEGIPQLQYDITGKLRTGDEAPDLGAYEF